MGALPRKKTAQTAVAQAVCQLLVSAVLIKNDLEFGASFNASLYLHVLLQLLFCLLLAPTMR